MRNSRQTPSASAGQSAEHRVDEGAPDVVAGVGRAPAGAADRAQPRRGAAPRCGVAAADDRDRLEDAVPAAEALVERGHHRLVGRDGHRRAVPPDRHRCAARSRPQPADAGHRLAHGARAVHAAGRRARRRGAARRAAAGPRPAPDRRSAQQVLAAVDGPGARHPGGDRRAAARGGRPGGAAPGHLDGLPEPGAARAARPGLAHPPRQGRAGLPRRRAPAPARRLRLLRGDRRRSPRTSSTAPRNVWPPIWVSPWTWDTSPCPGRAARAANEPDRRPHEFTPAVPPGAVAVEDGAARGRRPLRRPAARAAAARRGRRAGRPQRPRRPRRPRRRPALLAAQPHQPAPRPAGRRAPAARRWSSPRRGTSSTTWSLAELGRHDLGRRRARHRRRAARLPREDALHAAGRAAAGDRRSGPCSRLVGPTGARRARRRRPARCPPRSTRSRRWPTAASSAACRPIGDGAALVVDLVVPRGSRRRGRRPAAGRRGAARGRAGVRGAARRGPPSAARPWTATTAPSRTSSSG